MTFVTDFDKKILIFLSPRCFYTEFDASIVFLGKNYINTVSFIAIHWYLQDLWYFNIHKWCIWYRDMPDFKQGWGQSRSKNRKSAKDHKAIFWYCIPEMLYMSKNIMGTVDFCGLFVHRAFYVDYLLKCPA